MQFKVHSQSGTSEPNSIPGLLLWIDASEAGTLSRSGTEAKCVFDKSAGGYSLQVKSLSPKPKILQSRFHGKTILRFENHLQILVGDCTLKNMNNITTIGVIDSQIIVDCINCVKIENNIITIPNHTNTSPPPSAIDVAEIMIFNTEALTSDRLQMLHEYLKNKWAL